MSTTIAAMRARRGANRHDEDNYEMDRIVERDSACLLQGLLRCKTSELVNEQKLQIFRFELVLGPRNDVGLIGNYCTQYCLVLPD